MCWAPFVGGRELHWSVVQVGQLTRAPDRRGNIKLQYADGSTSDHVKVDLVAKAS